MKRLILLGENKGQTCFPQALERISPNLPGLRTAFVISETQNNQRDNDSAILQQASKIAEINDRSEADYVFVDRSTEVGTIANRDDLWERLSHLSQVPMNHIFYVSQNYRLSNDRNPKTPKYIFYHHYMIAMAKAYAKYLPQHEIFSKEVLCMNGKIRPHRVAAMNMLTGICRDRLTYSWRDHENLYSQKEALLHTARDFPTFHSEANDRPFERCEFRASIENGPLGIPEAESQRAFLHFVTESDYSRFVDRFTEKILKPIIMRRPFLVLGPPNILRRLRFFGFSTFSDVFDESYDQIDDPDERLQALRASLLSILSMEPEKVVEACYKTCTFNNRFLRENLIKHEDQHLIEQITAHVKEDSILFRE
jgi:hypothetical protein